MLGGASENVAPPVKPWEVSSSQPSHAVLSSLTNTFAPPPPPLPLSIPTNPDPYSQTSAGIFNSGGYYGGGYGGNRFGYSSNYNSGFSSYSHPYYGNTGQFGGGPPAPGSYITSSLENTTRPLFDSVNHVLQAINHVACFIDSTVFAVWTSVSAAGSILATIKSVKNVYLRQWAEYLRTIVQKLKSNLRTESGRKRILLLISVIASIPVLLKALHSILNLENDTETALILHDRVNETESIVETGDDILYSKAIFVRALYPLDPVDKEVYLKLNPGDVILISKEDELKLAEANPSWIAGKLKNGLAGFFPSNYVTVIK